ncbi:MAG TPA: BlaI/MecI/CopY family transcriptional regulator [Acidimicrobiales bacterium]|jgi:predicted transcriptional regulator|nr:BlaI/MecI/CopY family transcriptional regulator [Acidimicrobiales bacterium]
MPKTTCDNPMCSCDPCTCEACSCGVARVGELERRVMTILWEQGDELTGRQVADALPEHAYTTVATVLDRLVHKGLVRRRKLARSIRFAAVGTQGAHTAVLMHEALSHGQDPGSALVHFAGILSPEEVAVLRRSLDERGNEPERSGRAPTSSRRA